MLIRVSILSLCLSILLMVPVYANEFCANADTIPPANPRLETTLKVDLSDNNEGTPAFLEWYTLPADQAVQLAMQNKSVSAQALALGDTILMEGGKVGRITSADTHLYSPESHYVNSQAQGYRRVLAKSKRWTETLLLIHTQDEIIKTTPEHPFYVNGQWVNAQDLNAGDQIASINTDPVVVESIELKSSGQFVNNLKVEGAENFYVGEAGLLTHNCVPELALGLSSKLDDFAKQKRATTYLRSSDYDPFGPVQDHMKPLINNAPAIHFNLEDFDFDVFGGEYWRNYRVSGTKAIKDIKDIDLILGGMTTNWELDYVLTTPAVRNKTLFYDRTDVFTGDQLIQREGLEFLQLDTFEFLDDLGF